MPTTRFALILVILLSPSLGVAATGPASGQPSDAAASDARAESKEDPQSPPPSANPGPKRGSANSSGGASGGPARLEREGSTGQSHLSSDQSVNLARVLIERNRFAEALEILRPLAPDHPDQTDVQFLLGLAASRASHEEVGA